MVFSSLTFLFAFLPVFFLCYFLLGKLFGIRGKNIALFLFSLVFYAWGEPVYVLLMVYSTILDYTCGRMIEAGEKKGRPKQKKAFLTVSMIGNLALLAVFKYLTMMIGTANTLFGTLLPVPEIVLPIGISFYTFQTMSYSIDVYRGKVEAQHDFINFGAYVAMFPQLIAGPIVRYEAVAAQLNQRTETLEDFAAGARRFIVGLGKKVLIANTMAQTADALFENPASSLGSLGAWVAILAYTFQIFFDFSGYSDMAIGLGRMMGFHYPENFNYPYIASSVTEFWRRWHITMSSFFRDYIYIPMGGSRVSRPRWILNIFVVWFLTGLWHGASWNFVLWGLYFGFLLVLEKLVFRKWLEKGKILPHVWSLFFIVYGWVIFTQETLGGLWEYTKALFGGYGFLGTAQNNAVILLQRADVNTVFFLMFAAAVLFSMPFSGWLKRKLRLEPAGDQPVPATRALVCGILLDTGLILILLLCTVQLVQGSYNPFIYFRF
ncbi:MAG: MBOAT family protein [Clostridia bacterium]|nr:MBOAT family protein [Clostridia bacterium]